MIMIINGIEDDNLENKILSKNPLLGIVSIYKLNPLFVVIKLLNVIDFLDGIFFSYNFPLLITLIEFV